MIHRQSAGALRSTIPWRTRRCLVLAMCALVLAGCGGTKRGDDATAAAPEAARPNNGLEAQLRPIGPHSAAQGSVRFTRRDNGVAMLVTVAGLAPGQYRVVVHENGNCSSPNGFSAGPPWAGAPGIALQDRVPLLTTNSEGNASLSMRLYGVTIADGPTGLLGRSVVLHDGYTGPLTTEPDARNGRIACGVIVPAETLF